jgi:hypothetical protein
MKKLLAIGIFMLIGGCAGPRDEAYCDSFRLPKNGAEYAACKAYYARMDKWFSGDLNACENTAILAVPEYMYDHARYGEAQSIDRFGNLRSTSIVIEPDYARNQSLDEARERIIAPCMRDKGWKNHTSWQAGRMGEKAPSQF